MEDQKPKKTMKPKRSKRSKQARPERTAAETAAMHKKAELIHAKLKEIYPVAPSGFLDNRDPFTLLVATVLSAQCLDSTVNTVTPSLFAAAPTPAAMRDLGAPRIKSLIARIGLSDAKSRYLAGLSAALCAEHGGQVPDTLEALERLPGVGHKTASVVLIQAFGKPAFPVDTHIHRLACRWGLGDPKSVERTEEAYKEWFPEEGEWGPLHTRLISFGREYCPARMHDMEECPVCSFAATKEARAANRRSPKKFVGAATHKNPYEIRANGETVTEDASSADEGTPPPGADGVSELTTSTPSPVASQEVAEAVIAAAAGGKKKAAAEKKGRVAKAAPKKATAKKTGSPKGTKSKRSMWKATKPSVRKSARIAAQTSDI